MLLDVLALGQSAEVLLERVAARAVLLECRSQAAYSPGGQLKLLHSWPGQTAPPYESIVLRKNFSGRIALPGHPLSSLFHAPVEGRSEAVAHAFVVPARLCKHKRETAT
ncbi:MAG: hypothetical protein JSS44_10170 [Proteobacteria bacterium]|nr:hypothetical protein [Pseudomonadota bacterium]